MFLNYPILFFVFLVNIQFLLGNSELQEILDIDENQVVLAIDKMLESDIPINEKLLESLIKRGFFKAADQLYLKYFAQHKIILSQNISQQIEKIKKDLESFQAILEYQKLDELPMQYILESIIEQLECNLSINGDKARNLHLYLLNLQTELTVLVKFQQLNQCLAHINIKNLSVSLKEKSFELTGISFQNQRAQLKFELNLTLFDFIDVNTSYYNQGPVGTLILNLTKQETKIWRRLSTDEKIVPTWWEARTQYQKDMKKYFDLLESEENEEEENTKLHKKNSMKKKAKKQKSKNGKVNDNIIDDDEILRAKMKQESEQKNEL